MVIALGVLSLISCNSGSASTANTLSSANADSNQQKLNNIRPLNNNNSLIWTKQVGVSGADIEARGIAVDDTGNSYVVGYTDTKFGSEPQNGCLTDAYLAKYDNHGNSLWVHQLGSIKGNTKGNAIALDGHGSIFITGFKSATFNCKSKKGTYDYFIAKYDINGVQDWIESSATTNGDVEGNGIAVDNVGNVYITGSTTVGINGQAKIGDIDYFVVKYNITGSLIWTKQAGRGKGERSANAIALDDFGNVYITGWTNKAISGSNPDIIGDNLDGILVKYDSSGNQLWAKELGAKNWLFDGEGIAIDKESNVYITGSAIHWSPTKYRFISKYDTNGNYAWTNTNDFILPGYQFTGNAITVDGLGNSYLINRLQFDDIDYGYYFAEKYDTNRVSTTIDFVGYNPNNSGIINTNGTSIAFKNGILYIAGFTNIGISGQTQIGKYDSFVASYSALAVLMTSPNNTSNVSIEPSFELNFNASVYNVNNTTVTLRSSNGTNYPLNNFRPVEFSDNKNFTFQTAVKLPPRTNFVLSVNGVNGVTNKAVPSTTFYFTTANYQWAKQLGVNAGFTQGAGVTVDNNGNSYITGYTTKSLGNGTGDPQQGMKDYFIAKYSNESNLLWVHQVGGLYGDTRAKSITVDMSGNAYIIGNTNVGINGQPALGNMNCFIAKYDTNGNLLWSKQIAAIDGTTYGTGITYDRNGYIYITGYTTKAIDNESQVGLYDYFIAKYDANGNLVWVHQNGSLGGMVQTNGIAIDSFGNPYIVGSTNRGLNGQTQNGGLDFFVIKYNSDGNIDWTRQDGAIGGTTAGNALAVDGAGNVAVTGNTNVGLNGQLQRGISDYFLVLYDNYGNLNYTSQAGAVNGKTQGNAVAIDKNGNISITGNTNVGINNQAQKGQIDYFVAEYANYPPRFNWGRQVGLGGGTSRGNGIVVDSNGNISIIGDTTVGINNQTQTGLQDSFIVKY